jgi:hypothetical protein
MVTGMTGAFKKECVRAAYEYSGKHFWGDKSNAGKFYKRGKNATKETDKKPSQGV